MTSPARIVALATIFVALASMSCSTSIRLLPPAGVTELRARAELGIAGAQFNLGVMYANGRGVLQDDFEAVHWYRRAADQGLAGAQFNLGVMYANGRGVLQDYVQAHMWFNLGASRSTGEERERAVRSRDVIADELTPDDLSEAQRLAREWDAAHPRGP